MVVQCPTCQSKFRIADDKVTDRGVRVRCTSCKNVFQVRKPGSATDSAVPGPGHTMDLSSLGASAVARPGAASRPATARPGASKPAPARPAPAASRPAPAAARSGNGTARRLDADDLFGMSELTGEAPLVESKPPPKPATKAMPNFDDIDLEVPDEPAAPPPPPRPPTGPVKSNRPPTGPVKSGRPPTGPVKTEPPPPPPADEPPPADDQPTAIGAVNVAMKDPFEGMNLGEPGTGAIDIATQKKKDKLAEAAAAEVAAKLSAPPPPPPPAVPEMSPGRAFVSSALTGLVGAALAIAVVIVSALSDESSTGWLGFGRGSEVVATRVVSGLYDTASGKPVFYVRGRVENRSEKTRGPIRVTAELVADGAAEVRAEALAGAEPTAEEVWSLRSAADVEKLEHSLEISRTERKVEPGKSLPFFAVIADPPADLQRHRLHVKVEPVDAWVPQRKGK